MSVTSELLKDIRRHVNQWISGSHRDPDRAVRCYSQQRELDGLIDAAIAQFCSKVEHPLGGIKQQFGFLKIWLRVVLKSRCKINVLAALTNLFLVGPWLPLPACGCAWSA